MRRGLHEVRHWPSLPARQWLERFLAAAPRAQRVQAIVLTGSAARPVEAVADLDLVVIYKGSGPDLGRPPMDVDVRSYRSDQVEALLDRNHDLLGWTLRFGVPLFERHRYWTRLRRRWLDRLPMPSADAAEERARRAEVYMRDLLEIGDGEAAREQELTLLTHQARARLIRNGVLPLSRPELAAQLDEIGDDELAGRLRRALEERPMAA